MNLDALVIDYNPHIMKYNTVAAGFITWLYLTSADEHASIGHSSAQVGAHEKTHLCAGENTELLDIHLLMRAQMKIAIIAHSST